MNTLNILTPLAFKDSTGEEMITPNLPYTMGTMRHCPPDVKRMPQVRDKLIRSIMGMEQKIAEYRQLLQGIPKCCYQVGQYVSYQGSKKVPKPEENKMEYSYGVITKVYSAKNIQIKDLKTQELWKIPTFLVWEYDLAEDKIPGQLIAKEKIECCVCLDEVWDTQTTWNFNCPHTLCKECSRKVQQSQHTPRCPYCRSHWQPVTKDLAQVGSSS